MPSALICSTADVEAELGHTVLWRMGLKRHVVKKADEAKIRTLVKKAVS